MKSFFFFNEPCDWSRYVFPANHIYQKISGIMPGLLLLLLYSLWVFPASFFWRYLSDRTSPQVSRTLLNILADFNSAVVWMVSILIPISNSPVNFPVFKGRSTRFNNKWYHRQLCFKALSALPQDRSICQSFRFLFTQRSTETVKSTG